MQYMVKPVGFLIIVPQGFSAAVLSFSDFSNISNSKRVGWVFCTNIEQFPKSWYLAMKNDYVLLWNIFAYILTRTDHLVSFPTVTFLFLLLFISLPLFTLLSLLGQHSAYMPLFSSVSLVFLVYLLIHLARIALHSKT